jgi:hypothetical protein
MYLTAPSLGGGTTKVFPGKKEDIAWSEGPPGSYLLFNPVTIPHSGIPPTVGTRVCLELIIVPSHKTEINPTFNGTNSTLPINP